MDLATIMGLRRYMKLRLIISGYDIACQYWVNFWARLALMPVDLFPWLAVLAVFWPLLRNCVPKFHLPAHKGVCRWLNSFHYMLGAGDVDGEESERRWAHDNALARSTREMGPGHRHDILNHHTGDYCIQKTFGIGMSALMILVHTLSDMSTSKESGG
jgi:hypothetical protein